LILPNKPYEYSFGNRKPPSQPATSQARRGETLAGKVAFGERLGREEEIGQLMVQGLDYNYTLHGWLKGVNSASLNLNRDPGHDGVSFIPIPGGIHSNVARDVMGFNLGYYTTDYTPISDQLPIPIPTANKFLPATLGSDYSAAASSLYNGNIRMMHTGLKPIIDGTTQHIGMAYRYDQLNRISSSTAFDNYNNTTNEWGIGGVALIDYSVLS
jgi:hypothetical protein